MTYILQAFITKKSNHKILTDSYKKSIAVEIGHELSLIPFTTELFDEMNKMKDSKPIGKFDYLTENIEVELLKQIGDIKFAYIEADYFGGEGGQIAIIWEKQKRTYLSEWGDWEINKVLKDFGTIAKDGKDEFDTVGLGQNRRTKEWLNESE